jgi:hypothetical protein
MALGEQAPDIAAALAYDAMDAILAPAVDRLLPEYAWDPMPGYNWDTGEQADRILERLRETIDPLFESAATCGQ